VVTRARYGQWGRDRIVPFLQRSLFLIKEGVGAIGSLELGLRMTQAQLDDRVRDAHAIHFGCHGAAKVVGREMGDISISTNFLQGLGPT